MIKKIGDFPLTSLRIDPTCFDSTMFLNDIIPNYAYENNKKTDTITGYKYIIVLADMNFAKLTVKIPGKKRMDMPSDKPYCAVKLDKLTVKLYFDNAGALQLTASADDIHAIDSKL